MSCMHCAEIMTATLYIYAQKTQRLVEKLKKVTKQSILGNYRHKSLSCFIPGPRPTSMPRAILIHPAVWPQWTWAENWGALPPGSASFLSRGLGPHLTQSPLGGGLPPYEVASWCIQTFGHNRNGPKIGKRAPVHPFVERGAGSPSNTESPGLRPTFVPSGILMHPAIWPQ